MTPWFLHGALADRAVLAALIGAKAAATAKPAHLCDHVIGLGPEARAGAPMLWPRAGSDCDGVILDLTDGDAERLEMLAAGLRLGRRGRVEVNGHPACAILGPQDGSGTAWDAAAWHAVGWPEILAGALDEIASLGRRWSGETLARRMPMVLSRAAARVAAAQSAPVELRSSIPRHRVVEKACRTPHAGFFLTRSYDLRPPRLRDGPGAVLRREVFVATDAAIVLPYDSVRDRVLLVEQFRMGPYGRHDPHPYVLEPVAGHVDAGEDPETAARRECEEEAGITLNRVEKISAHYCSPGCSTEFFHVFLGVCDLPNVGHGSGGLDAEHEDIRTHVLSFEQAMALLDSGEANVGPLVLALLWLARERDWLRAEHRHRGPSPA